MTDRTDRLLPQNVEAEMSVLGSILIDPEAREVAAAILAPDDFYRAAHTAIFRAMLDMAHAHPPQPADLITLVDELARTGRLDEVGGASYVSSLGNRVPTSANVEFYARRVQRTAINRRLIHAAEQIAALAFEDGEADNTLGQAQHLLLQVAQQGTPAAFVPFDVALDEAMDDVLSRFEHAEGTGIRTGFRLLDQHIVSLEPGELVYLCGVPGSGKSTLAHCIIRNLALEYEARGEGAVAWATLEMRKAQVAKRIVASHAGVDGRRIRAGFRFPDGSTDIAGYARYRASWQTLRDPLGRRLHVCDSSLTMKQLRTHLTRSVAEHGCRFAVVDYIGLMVPDDRRQVEYQRISDMSRDLKQLAGDLGLVVLCLVQMSRKHEERANKRPVLNDLRDSGGLGQDADWVWGLYRGAVYERARAADDERFRRFTELGIVKAREGVAEGAWVPLRAELEYSRFVDWPDGVDWPVDTTRDQASGPSDDHGASSGGQEGRYA